MKRIVFIAIFLLISLSQLKAQDLYVGFSTGITHSTAENMTKKEVFGGTIASGMLSIGNNFSPRFGIRLQAGYRPQAGMPGTPQTNVYPDIYNRYNFTTLTGDLDLTFNLTNIFDDPNPMRIFEVQALIGGGMIKTDGFSSKVKEWEYYPVDTKGGNYITANIGIQGLFRLSKHWKAMGEFKVYAADNAYNGVKSSNGFDTFLDFQIGMVYYFNSKYHNEILPVELRHNYLPEYKQGTLFSAAGASLNQIMFYLQRSNLIASQQRLVADIAQYLKEHPNATINLYGRPDDTSGESIFNNRLAQQRVEAVRDHLVELGIPSERLNLFAASTPVKPIKEVGEWVAGVTFELK